MSAGVADFFCREAQRLRYAARSAFKLLQIQKRHQIIRPGASVLDLGCAPGAWLQVACQSLGPLDKGGVVLGVDVKKVKAPADHCDERVKTVCADVMRLDSRFLLDHAQLEHGFSVVLSDMCPRVSGIGSKDTALSFELGFKALRLAVGGRFKLEPEGHGLLLPGGAIVIKLLEGEESQGLFKLCEGMFRSVVWTRPKATRSSSREIYLICKGLK
ncbi:hypothetical protein KP509_21G047900 [Ceratopteris richardii]|uniref:rRNA methyltransferase 2, mitochondrial n=1 Tax=Ceratopteris richardii TaxID=49495 RepID=A0A8T2SCK6_CERRI|nr:hypothetical protein KP509_21G047900 [Ceratopteris richardii]KAH7315403.1 hypothetical protein KP509_21G047900 [Ceratopteris richardii]KAH7315404.1 hypothetical protein KP509_21G047900 [Ceratopteris richardii]